MNVFIFSEELMMTVDIFSFQPRLLALQLVCRGIHADPLVTVSVILSYSVEDTCVGF